MLALFPVFLLLGLFLPGFFIAKYLRHQSWWASAVPLSLIVLFHSIFWLAVFHVAITLWTVLPGLVAVSTVAAWLQRRDSSPMPTDRPSPRSVQDMALILSSAFVGVVLFVHSAISPLMGGDAPFRWDFLAQRLLALGRFDFYPPLSAPDFRTYFFVDGIPPLVSFTYWWLYASAGRYMPSLISIFVAAQFACTLAFTYGTASVVFSRRAGILAAAILAASPLYFRSVVLGQETGLTALAIAATIYFIVSARESSDIRAMVSAGLAAALCALSREYGWIAVIAGVIALVWRRQPRKQVFIFCITATVVAAPWYIRNWILSGNPFYSLRFGSFAVNEIHDRILHFYSATLAVQHWTLNEWVNVLSVLLLLATIQVLAGIPGGFKYFRAQGYLIVIAFLLIVVWIQSVGFTSGGAEGSMRVLSPALVVLSITGAGLLEPLTRRARWYTPMTAAIIAWQFFTAAEGAVSPNSLASLRPGQWLESAFPRVPPPAEVQVRDKLVQLLPPGQRVLSDSAYLHAALIDKGIEVVPVWSPEVRFIFSSSPEEADRRLRELRIGSVVIYPQTMNMTYLTSASPFYATLPERWRPVAQVGDFLFVLAPKNP
jgi:hypothetical protein